VNTITKMSAKRAEVDAAQNLPGVATAIAKLRKQGGGGERSRWDSFWGDVTRMGLEQKDAHMICRVKSMKEWEEQGRTLDEALKLIREWVVKQGTKEETPLVDQLFPPKEEVKRGTIDRVQTIRILLAQIKDLEKSDLSEFQTEFLSYIKKRYGAGVIEELSQPDADSLIAALRDRKDKALKDQASASRE